MLAASWLFFFISRSHTCVFVCFDDDCSIAAWMKSKFYKLYFMQWVWVKKKLYLISCMRLCFAFILRLFMLLFHSLYIIIREYLLFGDLAVFSLSLLYTNTHTQCALLLLLRKSDLYVHLAYHFAVDFRIKNLPSHLSLFSYHSLLCKERIFFNIIF